MKHLMNITCMSCELDKDYHGEDLPSMAIRVPYCCHAPEHVVTVSVRSDWKWAPARGDRFTVTKGQVYEGVPVDYNDMPSSVRGYYPRPPKNSEEEVYFVSQIGPDGPYRDSRCTLDVNTLEHWRSTPSDMLNEYWNVPFMEDHPQELPAYVFIVRRHRCDGTS